MPSRILFLLAVSLLLLGQGERRAHAQCKLSEPVIRFRAEGPCSLRDMTVRVEDRICPVEVKAQEMSCGRLSLSSTKVLIDQAVEACRANQEAPAPMEFYLHRSFEVVSQVNNLVSVDEANGSYTGGAHPGASLRRRTYSLITGREVSLSELFPDKAKGLLAKARKRFDQKNKENGFSWDERAFAVASRGKASTIEFACPHQVEVHAGQTLKVKLTVETTPVTGPPPVPAAKPASSR